METRQHFNSRFAGNTAHTHNPKALEYLIELNLKLKSQQQPQLNHKTHLECALSLMQRGQPSNSSTPHARATHAPTAGWGQRPTALPHVTITANIGPTHAAAALAIAQCTTHCAVSRSTPTAAATA
jgi:hypothetical protein